MERRLTAILAADVVGYSRLMEWDEEETLKALRECREVVDGIIADHKGRIFTTAGDSVIAEFHSPVEALRAAVEIQQELASKIQAVLRDKRLLWRIGVNLGDVMAEGDNLFGDGVNIAARLQTLAEPGGIAVSGTIVEHTRNKVPLHFDSLGEHRVRNIVQPIAVYRVRVDGTARGRLSSLVRQSKSRSRPVAILAVLVLLLAMAGGGSAIWSFYLRHIVWSDPPVRSIAVLPFENFSGDPTAEYFSNGITENIIGGLARSADLHVISRTSTAGYKGRPVDVRQIGRDLNVRYVLEGSVHKGTDKVRIVAQLIDAYSGEHVWADRFDKSSSDPLELQDEVTGNVVSSLAGHGGAIQKKQYEEAWGRDRARLQEYDYFLRGHSYFMRWSKEDMAEARRIFEEGLAKFPDSRLMHSKIGWTYYQDWSNGWSETPQGDLRRAYELAQYSLAMPNAPPITQWYGHWLRALTELYYKRDAAAAAREAEAARALAPYDPILLADLARIFVWAGKPERAIDWLQGAMRRASKLCCDGQLTLSSAYNRVGQYEAAVAELQKCDDCDPFYKNWQLMVSFARLGRANDARAAADAMRKARPEFTTAKARAELYYTDEATTERELNELRQMGFPDA